MRVAIITFIISVGFTFLSRGFLSWLGTFSSFLLLIAIVLVGIVFDAIGVATTAAEERPFHAMAADKVPGSREAVWLVRNADKVGSFTQDIVGDIAGTLSGAIGALIVLRIVALRPALNETVAATVLVGIVAALTVAGKAYGKVLALQGRTHIVLRTGRLLHRLDRLTGIRIANMDKRARPGRKGDQPRTKRRKGAGVNDARRNNGPT